MARNYINRDLFKDLPTTDSRETNRRLNLLATQTTQTVEELLKEIAALKATLAASYNGKVNVVDSKDLTIQLNIKNGLIANVFLPVTE
jgi:hypothetical protein